MGIIIKSIMKRIDILSLLLLGAAQAYKDDSYYNANSGNPNVDLKMYWKDADNILEDLYSFDSLYVEYHSCVWSWMNYGSRSDDDEIEENDYWYMGSVPPMGANVAFSLYGSLYGEQFTGCNKDTFINSFYTNTGFTDFASAMYYSGMNGFSNYKSSSSNYNNRDLSSSSSKLSAQCMGGYGVGCSYGQFALHTYSTSTCDPAKISGTKDTLDSLNSAMSNAQCVKIFDINNFKGYNYISGTSLQLLASSTACNYMNMVAPDGNCPDPYGRINYYISNFNEGIKKKHEDPFIVYYEKMDHAWQQVYIGAGFLGLALLVLICDKLTAYCTYKNRCIQGIDTTRLLDDITESLATSKKRLFSSTAAAVASGKTGIDDEADHGTAKSKSASTYDGDVVEKLHADQKSKNASPYFKIEENFSDLSGSQDGHTARTNRTKDTKKSEKSEPSSPASSKSSRSKKSLGSRGKAFLDRLRGKSRDGQEENEMECQEDKGTDYQAVEEKQDEQEMKEVKEESN